MSGAALNILVASIATWQFRRAGHFSWRTFWPFAALAVPCVRGRLPEPARHVFKVLVGIILLYSAARFLLPAPPEQEPKTPPRTVALASGGAIGLLSGLTGTGGGIFLTPLLLLARWARVKTAAAVALSSWSTPSPGLPGTSAAPGDSRHLPSSSWQLQPLVGLSAPISAAADSIQR
jgi:uncharacterized membrane protein YfcA